MMESYMGGKRRQRRCDACDGLIAYGWHVEVRMARRSDPSDKCCIMIGCDVCFRPQSKFDKNPSMLYAHDWDGWIEDVGVKQGFMFLT